MNCLLVMVTNLHCIIMKRLSFIIVVFFILSMPFLSSCLHYKNFDWYIGIEQPTDTIIVDFWDGGHYSRTIPFLDAEGRTHTQLCFSFITILDTQPDEWAWEGFRSNYDSVKITRKADGASTITYSYNAESTEEQRFFFTEEAWYTEPEGSTNYYLILADDMFQLPNEGK